MKPWVMDWQVEQKGNSWYIYNTRTGKYKRVGPIRLTGTNYYDKAQELADKLNNKLHENQE